MERVLTEVTTSRRTWQRLAVYEDEGSGFYNGGGAGLRYFYNRQCPLRGPDAGKWTTVSDRAFHSVFRRSRGW